MAAIVWCFTGPPEDAEARFAPIRSAVPEPLADFVGPLPFPAFQSMFDPLHPARHPVLLAGGLRPRLSDDAIACHVEHGSRLPTALSTMHIYPIDGAVQRVGRNDTAFSYRDADWVQVIVGFDMDPANADLIRDWTIDYWDALHPLSESGAYVNFMMDEGADRIRPPTATTTTDWPTSRAATTRPTSST